MARKTNQAAAHYMIRHSVTTWWQDCVLVCSIQNLQLKDTNNTLLNFKREKKNVQSRST